MPKVTVKVTPDVRATVRVAGQVLDGETVEVPREPGYVSVAVSAPGFMPFRKLVELRGAETTVEVKLVPLRSRRRKPMPYVLGAMVLLALVKLALSC